MSEAFAFPADADLGAVLVTTQDAARILKRSIQTLANWRVQGRGPRFVSYGGRVLYERAALESFIAQHVRRSTSDVAAPIPPLR
ncbi:MAG: helix-turn-helix domain-containing protein [Gemmatimonadetes bacterium]|mgnify:CR=1 FL=1|nr:helix-turn-helix domain-containing protein [Gemmatimonadota bacterium]MBK6455376.1 helix-turn-helix domain-containing protein [Gemmatimonadota bacterium]MBK7835251.1 helix-turn-helix domain-containing protein [Gemmatimonadota bacterium]MBK9406594.1 helix-turn-helix domain-containing protein [Gemmatimonadota bacterium]